MHPRVVLPWWDPEDKRNYKSVLWNVTRQCNRCCDFCPFHDNSLPTLPSSDLIRIAEHVCWQLSQCTDESYLQLILFGGEPTLVGLETLSLIAREWNTVRAARTVQKRTDLLMYSNMNQDYEFYQTLLLSGMTKILASYHGQDLEDMDRFLTKIYEFVDDGFESTIQVLVMDTCSHVSTITQALRAYGVQCDVFKPHRHEDVSVLRESEKIDVAGWKRVVETNRNCFRGWSCLAGSHHAYIEYDGSIYPCQGISQALLTNKLTDDGSWLRGNALNGDPLFGEHVSSCPTKACRFELAITKYQDSSN